MHQVTLPESYGVTYPDRCAVCGAEAPDNHVRVDAYAGNWAAAGFWAIAVPLPGRRTSVEIPVCTECRRYTRRRRWLVWSILLVNAAVAMGVVYWFFGFPEGFSEKRLLMVGGIVLMIPGFALCLRFRPPLDLSVDSDTVTYEFANEAYAEEFEYLNSGPDEVQQSLADLENSFDEV